VGDEFLRGLGSDIERGFKNAEVSTSGIQQLQFEFLVPSEEAALQFATRLRAQGFACKYGELEDDDRWLCHAAKALEIDVSSLNELGDQLVRFVEHELKGEFNGWSLLASAKDLLNPKAPVLNIGQFDVRNLDVAKYPHVVIARVFDAVEPIDRGDKYDDRLKEKLVASGRGVLVAAGSQLNRDRDVVAIRFEFHLSDLNGAVDAVRQALRECGAPRGSFLWVNDRAVPIHDA
jgi:hypothetical protein